MRASFSPTERARRLRAGMRAPRSVVTAALTALVFAAVCAAIAVRGPSVVSALLACPLAAAVAAIGVHAATLFYRCEAWRLAVAAIGEERLPRVRIHAASGAGFAVGSLQGAGAAPTRALTLRRLCPGCAPPARQLIVAEVPVFLVEAALAAIVLALAVLTAPVAPPWTPAAIIAGCAVAVLVLRHVARRARRSGAGAGLRVLTDRRRAPAMLSLLVVVTSLGLLRAWIVLAGFGLPTEPASVAVAFVSLGIFGLLPIGPGSTPGAMLVAFGAADPSAAAAAGIAISATSFAGVAVYAAVASLVLAIASRLRSAGEPGLQAG